MASLAQKIQVEDKMRKLLAENDMPGPDVVEYDDTCIRLLFHQTKTCVVVDIDEPPEGGAGADHLNS